MLDRQPTRLEVANQVGLNIDDIDKAILSKGLVLPGDEQLHSRSDDAYRDTLFDTLTYGNEDASINELDGPSQTIMREEIGKDIHRWSNYLTGREFTVICLRYGIGIEEKTLAETGVVIGVSKERVRQVQNDALAKLQKKVPKEGLSSLELLACS